MPVTNLPPADADRTVCAMRAKRIGQLLAWLPGGVMALVCGAAFADEVPLHAPCLTAHADLSGYVTAMEADGWTHLEADSDGWNAAAAVVMQPNQALQLMVSSFDTLQDVTEFSERATRRGALTYRGDTALFTRDAASAAVVLIPLGEDALSLTCTFAASGLPQVADRLAEGANTLGGIMLAHDVIALNDARETYSLDAVRLIGSPLYTAMLTGREALLLHWEGLSPE